MKLRNYIIIFILFAGFFSAGAQSVGLVLSGGGAKGLSHIGVIKALEENNIPIDYVSGTSMGAIVGGFYAIGLSPDEMVSILKSDAFQSWYRGKPEREFESFLYQDAPTSEMMRVSIGKKKDKEGKSEGLKLSLPINLVSPYPMDIAVVQLFGSSAAAANYDFNQLMIPFFCVAADVAAKKSHILSSGDLGSAIRSSMTFPGYFKPIEIDSLLLFDGGFYNNFPWELMKERFAPDIIVGAKCVKGETITPEEDNPIAILELMMTVDTDYSIPEEEGIVISDIYDYNLMDFDKVDEIVEKGYRNALKYIPALKERIKSERTPQELSSRRLDFRKKCRELLFNKITIEGKVNKGEKEYITKTISDDRDTFDFSQAKRGYYRVVASKTVNTFYPTAKMNKDSLFTLNIKATTKKEFSIGVGGNISSSSLTHAHVGFSYVYMGRHPVRSSLNVDVGQFYTGANFSIRQDFSVKPMVYYNVDIVSHRFDYFTSNKGILFSNTSSSNIRENENFASLSFGMPLSTRYWMLLNAGITGGINIYDYYPVISYSRYDVRDKNRFSYISPRLWLEQNTLNYKQFPTEGKHRMLDLRYLYGYEVFTPGTLTDDSRAVYGKSSSSFLVDLYAEHYFPIAKWFTLGFTLNFVVSSYMNLADYTSTILMTPSFTPTVHSRTLLLNNYRAPVFAGVAVSPIFKISPSLYFHTTAAYFQPYQRIVELAEGKFEYEDNMRVGNFMASVSFVWQTPFGPVSLACSYYNDSKIKWYPQLNIGFLIYKNRALRN